MIFYVSNQTFHQSAELGGFKDIFSQITGIAAPFANLIPGFGQYISAGLTVASGLTADKSGVAKGLEGITAFGNQVMQMLDQIAQMVQSGQMSRADAYTNADNLVAILSDPTKVYQAKNGKDAAALADFKNQAAAKAAAIKQIADQLSAGSSPSGSSSGSSSSEIISGLSNTYLFAGAAILGFLLLKR